MALNAAELQITITADASQAQAELNGVEGMISGVLVGNQIKNFGEDALGFVGDFISVGATFEEQMTLIDRIIGGSISHMDELKQKAIDADVRTMFDALEVTKGMEMLARSGFDAMQIIGEPGKNNGLIDAVLNFAGATAESTEVAGRSFAAVARIFQNSGVSMVDIADLMTAAVLRSGKSASEFMTAFQYVGSISQQFGTAPEDIVTVIALMEQLGVRSMSVGTSLRSFYSGIASNRGDIEALGVSLYTVDDAGQEVLRTLPDIIQQFHKLSQTMNPSDFYAMLEDTFGKPAASGLMTLFTTGAENMDDFKASMDGVNDAQSIMDARMNTLRGSLEKFSATWLGLKKVLGDSVSGYIKPIVDGATYLVNLLQNAPAPVLQATAAFIALAGAMAWLGGSMILINALTKGKGLGFLFGQSFKVAFPVLMPFALGLLAVGAAGLLIKDNFGGIKDTLKGIGDKWKEFKDRYREGMEYIDKDQQKRGFGLRKGSSLIVKEYTGIYLTVANALAAIRDMGGPDLLGLWKKLYPHVAEVGEGLGVIGRTYERLSNVIKKKGLAEGMRQLFMGDIGKDFLKGMGAILSEGPRLLGTFLRNFDTGSKQVNRLLKNLGSAFLLFGTVIESVFDGDFDKAREALGRMLSRLGNAAVDLKNITVRVLNWAFIDDDSLYERFKSWIMGKVTGSGDTRGTHRPRGAQESTRYSLGTVAVSVADWAIESVVDLYDRLSAWITGKLTGSADMRGTHNPRGNQANAQVSLPSVLVNIGEIKLMGISGWAEGETAKLQTWLDENMPDDLKGVITLGGFQLAFGEGAKGNWKEAVAALLTAEPIDVTPRVNMKAAELITDTKIGDQGESDGATSSSEYWKRFKHGFFHNPFIERWKEDFKEDYEYFWKPIFRSINDKLFDEDILYDPETGTLTRRKSGLERLFRAIVGTPGDIQQAWVDFWDPIMDNLTTKMFGGYEYHGGGRPDKVEGFFPKMWDDLKDALTPDLDFDAPQLPQWMNQDLKWLTGPVDNVVKSIDKQVDRLRRAWRTLQFWKDNPDGKEEPFMPEKGSVYDFQIPQAEDFKPGGYYDIPPAPPGDNKFGFLSAIPLNLPKLNYNADIQSETRAAGRTLQSFATRVPTQIDGFKSGMERTASEAMSRFQSALGIGFGGASRIASFGAQMVAIAAKPRDLYNDGFNVGYRLGQGMAAGMIAALGMIASARAEMEFTAGGGHAKSDPFSGGSSVASVPARQPTVVNQTNHIQMSVGEVEELVTAANFVGNLDRSRQITLGRV